MVKKEPNYPRPRKGQRLKCLACDGKGTVYSKTTGSRICNGCHGKGYIGA